MQSVTGFNLAQIGVAGVLAKGIQLTGESVREWSAYAEQVEKAARLSGVGSEEMSRLIQASDDFRVSQGALETAMAMALKNGFVPTIDNLADLSDKFLALESPADRAAMASKLFGRQWAEIEPLLRQGGDAIRNGTAAIDDSLIVTENAVRENKDYIAAMDALGDTWTGIKNQVGQMLLPALTDVSEGLYTILNYYGDIKNATMDGNAATIKATSSYKDYAREFTKLAKEIDPYNKDIANSLYFLHQTDSAYKNNTTSLGELRRMTDDQIISLALQEGSLEDLVVLMGGYSEQTYDAANSMDYADRMARNATVGIDELGGQANETAGQIDDIGAAADVAVKKVLGLNDIDLNLAGSIETELRKIEFMLAGGLDLQAVTDDITEAVMAGTITPEQAATMFHEAYVAAQELQVRTGEITATEAAQNIRDTLGVSLTEAKGILDDVIARFGDIPTDIRTTLTITEYRNIVDSTPNEESNRVIPRNANIPYQSRHAGGHVSAGMPYLVGEAGPEMVVPPENGIVVSNEKLLKLLGEGGRGAINITVYGADDPYATANEIAINFRAAQALMGA